MATKTKSGKKGRPNVKKRLVMPKKRSKAKAAPPPRAPVEEPSLPPVTVVELPEPPAVPRDSDAGTLPAQRDRSSYDGDTAIKLYLREIGQVKLLTPQEEIDLAARIKKGDKKAREQMIKANLRLVVKI